MSVYTSSNGLSWSAGTSALTCSGNETGLGNESVIPDPVTPGQWDMIYEATMSSGCTGSSFCLNVATLTASNPVGTWVKYSGNPITPNGGSGPAGPFYNSGTGQWWLYGHYVNGVGGVCSDLERWESTSLTGTWTLTPSWSNYPRITAAEACQNADPSIVTANGNVYLFYTASPLPQNTSFAIEEAVAPMQTLATLQTSTETTQNLPGDVYITPTQDNGVTSNNPYSVYITNAAMNSILAQFDTVNQISYFLNKLVISKPSGAAAYAVLDFLAPGNTNSYAGAIQANDDDWFFNFSVKTAGHGFHFNNGQGTSTSADTVFFDSTTPALWLYNDGTNGDNATINFASPGTLNGSPGGSSGRGQFYSNWREMVITTPFTGTGHGFHINNGSADIAYLDTGNNLWKVAGTQSGGTKFTTSGCSVSSTTGGASSGKMTVGANTCSVVITMNGATGSTASNGWSCNANDETTAAGNTALYFTANNTTTATLSVPATAGTTDVIDFACTAF
jgi:hypothetical protein